MSRIGRRPVVIPEKVDVSVSGKVLTVEGPLGKLHAIVPEGVQVVVEGAMARVAAPPPDRKNRGYQGLVRALLANMVTGVTQGYERKLEISGVGYKAEHKGSTVVFSLGFSHTIELKIPDGLEVIVDKSATRLTIKGPDKQAVGQLAAAIRSYKPPEPYKGKGIKYQDEVIEKKVGKTGAK